MSTPPAPLSRLAADVRTIVARQRAQQETALENLRTHLPLNDPDRHALDLAADTAFARLVSGEDQ